MSKALHNVVIPHKHTVYSHIQTYIRNKSKRSANTAKAYMKDFKIFFSTVIGKDIEHLNANDIKVNLSMLLDYQTLLMGSGKYKNKSINRMIASISSLYSYFKALEYDVNPLIFNEVKPLPNDTVKIGIMNRDEVFKISELAMDELHDGAEKKALILLAASTSIRKDAILNIEYNHIKKHHKKENVYVISSDQLFDKGIMVENKEIHQILYDMLLSLRSNKQKGDLIFTISPSTLDSTIKRLIKKAGLSLDRNLSFHSLKKAGVQLAFEKGGLRAAQVQAGHSNPALTSSTYIEPEVNIAGVALFEDTDNSIFDELTRDEMLVLLKGVENGVGSELIRKAKELMSKR